MTTVAILPVATSAGRVEYQAVSGPHRAVGQSAGQALDALAAEDPEMESAGLVIVQRFRPERQAQREVVVCGNAPDLNTALAKRIEHAASGSYVRHGKHRPNGLNHYQPLARPPAGPTFYETKNSRARKK